MASIGNSGGRVSRRGGRAGTTHAGDMASLRDRTVGVIGLLRNVAWALDRATDNDAYVDESERLLMTAPRAWQQGCHRGQPYAARAVRIESDPHRIVGRE
jgi:hypothetical protein